MPPLPQPDQTHNAGGPLDLLLPELSKTAISAQRPAAVNKRQHPVPRIPHPACSIRIRIPHPSSRNCRPEGHRTQTVCVPRDRVAMR